MRENPKTELAACAWHLTEVQETVYDGYAGRDLDPSHPLLGALLDCRTKKSKKKKIKINK